MTETIEKKMSEPKAGKTTPSEDAAAFVALRPRLFGVAYRMLGSRVEAEDVVQDVWLRWQAVDKRSVIDPSAFLVTTTTRAAINVSQSARARRETYIGPWLPDPIDTEASADLEADKKEGLAFAVMLLLERLGPVERAAYVLREAFDYDYERIAEILQRTEDNARQLVARAKKHVADDRKAKVSTAEQRRLLEAFVAAARTGDRARLEALFAADVASTTDSGGLAKSAARQVVGGRERVALLVSGFAERFWVGTTVEWRETNGHPAALVRRDGVAVALAMIDASADGIAQLYWVMHPEKLAALGSGP